MECSTATSFSLADALGPLNLNVDNPVREFEEDDEDENLTEGDSDDSKSGRSRKRKEKPPYSYIALIAMAISERPDKKATLAEIYSYLQEKFEFFRGDYAGWRNSIRHNLSLNECFIKLPKDTGESYRGRKGHKWTISDSCEFMLEENGFRRRPRGYKARKRQHFPASNESLQVGGANGAPAPYEYPCSTTDYSDPPSSGDVVVKLESDATISDQLVSSTTSILLPPLGLSSTDVSPVYPNPYFGYGSPDFPMQWASPSYDWPYYSTATPSQIGLCSSDFGTMTSSSPTITPQVSPYFYPPLQSSSSSSGFDDWRFGATMYASPTFMPPETPMIDVVSNPMETTTVDVQNC